MPISTILREFSELTALAEDWDRLWRAGPRREVFGSLDWIRAWWQAYGDELQLCTPVLLEGDRITGIWPLYLSRGRVRALGMPRSDYNDFLCEPGREEALFTAALDTLRDSGLPWTRLEVENVHERSGLVRAAPAASLRRSARMRLEPGQPSSWIDFGSADGRAGQRLLGNKHLRRKEKRLARLGPVRYRHLRHREDILRHLPSFFEQHIARRLLAGETASLFTEEQHRIFYRRLVEHLDPERSLRFGVLTAGRRIVAYHFGFEIDGRYICYKPTFDPRYADASPGEVLFRSIFGYVAERGLSVCDFTVGDEAFKRRFATHTARTYSLTVFRGGAGAVLGMGWEELKHTIKQHRRLEGALRSLAGRTG